VHSGPVGTGACLVNLQTYVTLVNNVEFINIKNT